MYIVYHIYTHYIFVQKCDMIYGPNGTSISFIYIYTYTYMYIYILYHTIIVPVIFITSHCLTLAPRRGSIPSDPAPATIPSCRPSTRTPGRPEGGGEVADGAIGRKAVPFFLVGHVDEFYGLW